MKRWGGFGFTLFALLYLKDNCVYGVTLFIDSLDNTGMHNVQFNLQFKGLNVLIRNGCLFSTVVDELHSEILFFKLCSCKFDDRCFI